MDNNQLVPVSGGGELATAEQLKVMFLEDAGAGLENVTVADIAVPYFKLLQKASPECEEGNPAEIKDSKPGMLLDSVNRALIDIRSGANKFAVVVPVSYEKVIGEWRPNQGGKVAEHPMSQAMLDGATRKENQDGGITLVNESGNTLEETAKFRILMLSAEGVHWGILALTGSKLGAAKKWLNLITAKKLSGNKTAPMFGFMYRVSSFLDTSKRTGKSYQQLRFENHGAITSVDMYNAAKEYRAAVQAGTVKDVPDTGETNAGAGGDDAPF